MTSRQDAINQLFRLTINYQLDGGVSNIRQDAPRKLAGKGLEWWQQASYSQHKSAVSLLNANVNYYYGERDDYGIWVCPDCLLQLIRDYYDS